MSLPIYVFPLKGKTPYPGCRWRVESRPREEWESWPSDATGYGVDCAKSHLVVIDEDIPGAVAEWLGYDPQPLTYTVETGRGRHFWFEEPEGVTIKSSTGKHGMGVDIKTAGGYVVGPGSIHLETGVEYRALNESPVAPIPAGILSKLGAKFADPYTGKTEDEQEQADADARRKDEGDWDYIDRQVSGSRWVEEACKLESARVARERLDAREAENAPPPDIATLGELLLREDPPEDRIKGLMPWEAAATVIAPNKTGKTTLIGNLVRALDTGEDFLGRFEVIPVREESRICVLNYEVSGTTFAKWSNEMGISHERLVVANLRGRSNPLASAATRKRFAEQLRPYNIESLIVDPFGRAFGGDQNSATDVQRWLNQLDQFAREDLGVKDLVLVVHAGWNDEHSRGSSALEDWPDVKWRLNKDDEGSRYFQAFGRDVDVEEDRLHYDHETRRLTLTGTGSRKDRVQAIKGNTFGALIADYLHQNPGASGKAIKAAISGNDTDITRALNGMVNDGTVVKTTRTTRGGGYSYALAAQNINQGGK